MISKERFRLLLPLNLFHTMAHIYPYLLPVLCLVIREDIPMDYTQTGILSMVGVLVTIPLTILFGFIGDKIKKWRLELIIAGFALNFSHTFIIVVAQTYAILILAAVIGGIGASVFHPIALPFLSQEFGVDRNIAHSFNLIFGSFGSIITPITSIALAEWLGWRTTSLVFGITGVILLPIFTIFTLIGKKYIQYQQKIPVKKDKIETRIDTNDTNNKKYKKLGGIITAPLIAVAFAQIIRGGTFRIMNTFTAFIFEDRFGASKIISSLIMSIIIASGSIGALSSGFISRKAGSLKTFVFAQLATTISAIGVVIFMGYITISNVSINIGMIILAIFVFISLILTFYFGDPNANSLFAELIPDNVLSTVFGVISALMTGFSAITPVIFGAIVDGGFSLPYEYLLLFVLAIIPLFLLLYVKSKIGFKTPDEVENERITKEQSSE
ncbi:MAG: MFS transporter [Candidatus Heimdallarchaeota archaeon]|nr:MFS transporter [Candidatus Heimdallarchaeota archaeon]